jgi:hypothetical protein
LIPLILFFGLCAARASEGDGTDASTDGSAVDTPAVPISGNQKEAEYIRISQEMEKLATRNAWPGVARMYDELVATGVPPSFEDLVIGAHAARALGDVASERDRLLVANGMKEDREILDWLWEIDSSYGSVFLGCDIGKDTFSADVMPFEPDQAQSVMFAQQQITEKGVFQGYLPQGSYKFGQSTFTVQPRVQTVSIDHRTQEFSKPPKKKKEKKKKE